MSTRIRFSGGRAGNSHDINAMHVQMNPGIHGEILFDASAELLAARIRAAGMTDSWAARALGPPGGRQIGSHQMTHGGTLDSELQQDYSFNTYHEKKLPTQDSPV